MIPAPKKLIIMIPCLNEEEALPTTLAALPREAPGVDRIEILIINDGSSDRTVEVARALGVHHILDFRTREGLARTFSAGLAHAARLGADYVVNLDADNQYDARDIPKLLQPLQEGLADMVVGERPIGQIEHFSPVKKALQKLGSAIVRHLSRTTVRDSPSGYRAFNRRAMARLFIFSDYTYTHESLVAAAESGIRVVGVPIRVNPGVMRPSRLMRSTLRYVLTSSLTILRFYVLYNPQNVFLSVAFAAALPGLILFIRFFYLYLTAGGQGHVQSLIVGAVLLMAAMFSFILAVFADIMRINRKLMQRVLSTIQEDLLPQHQRDAKGDSAARRNP
jgi:glycosyltransferase involved in cell wall biosynthesis